MPRALLAAALVILAAHASLFLPYTVDDSYIFFRYARSVAEGAGAVYNPGVRVEGFTSPAWMLLLAAAIRAGIDPSLAAKVLGVLAGAGTLVLTHLVSRRLRARPAESIPSLLFLAGCPLFAAWIGAGMDTALHAFVIMLAAWLALAGHTRMLTAVCAASLLVRPEGGLLFVLVFVAAPHLRSDDRLAGFRRAGLLAFGVTAAALTAARWLYFGDFVPNTFRAKVHPSGAALGAGLDNLSQLAAYLGPGLIALFLLGAWAGGRGDRFLAAIVAAHVAYVVAAGGDMLLLRMYVPLLAPLAVVLERGLLHLIALLEARGSALVKGRLRLAFLGALALAYLTTSALEDAAALNWDVAQRDVSYVVLNSRNVDQCLRPLGRWLRDNGPADAAVAIDDIGGLGWESRLPLVDLYGLTDRDLAAKLLTPGAVADEVFRRDPEWIVVRGRPGGPYRLRGDDVTGDPRLAAGWRVARTAERGSYTLTVFGRRDAAAAVER